MSTIHTNLPPIDTIIYSRSGHRAKYICSVAGHHGHDHFVRPEVEFSTPDGDVDSSFEGAAVWHEFFLAPPRAVIDKEIEGLEEKATALRVEINRLAQEKRGAEKDVEARKARLARHEQLKQLDDFITKGVSCYVLDIDWNSEIQIRDFKSTASEYNRDEFRLLCLFGSSNGSLDWKLNDYKDGSGNWCKCIPCASKDDVPAAVASLLEHRWAKWRKEGNVTISKYAQVARQYGLSVPEDVFAKIAKDTEEWKKTNLERAQKALAEAQAALMKAEEGVLSRMGVPAKPASATPKAP